MNLAELKQCIARGDQIVFFGGAGTSTESGIPDFRSESGLFGFNRQGRYSPEQILSHDFFMRHTEDFYSFYKNNMIYEDASPNLAHKALAKLERRGQLQAVITQNIDGLHQLAGSQNVLELHGSVQRNYCMSCRAFYELAAVMASSDPIPLCDCGGIIKPDVVLYQENLDNNVMSQAIDYIRKTDILIVAGTSLTVYPAAGLIRYYIGDKLVLINKSATSYDDLADVVIPDSIGKVLDALVEQL